jgi:cobyrinic acid a,c-diamide synthase
MKYVLVTGGVVSGLGKGVTASSIGLLLKACGLRITSIKIGLCFFFESFHFCITTVISFSNLLVQEQLSRAFFV